MWSKSPSNSTNVRRNPAHLERASSRPLRTDAAKADRNGVLCHPGERSLVLCPPRSGPSYCFPREELGKMLWLDARSSGIGNQKAVDFRPLVIGANATRVV